MKKILVITVEVFKNSGDEILGDTVNYLLNTINEDITICKSEAMPYAYSGRHYPRKDLICRFIENKILSRFSCDWSFFLTNILRKFRFGSYYEDTIKDYDGIILAIGMFTYSNALRFSYMFERVFNVAKKRDIPVYMHAVSVAPPNPKYWMCRQIKRSLINSSVKLFTTRDGDAGVSFLRNYYLNNSSISYSAVGDPALWIPECYNVNRVSDSTKIGIGVIRLDIFKDYNGGITRDELLQIYIGVIKELQRLNLDFEIFCNGMSQDYDAELKIIEACNLGKANYALRPQKPSEFVSIVSKYKVVFGARLHSCITSHSLGIPISGMVWEPKIRYFAESMGMESLFLDSNSVSSNNIVDNIIKSMDFKYDYSKRDNLKKLTQSRLREFIEKL